MAKAFARILHRSPAEIDPSHEIQALLKAADDEEQKGIFHLGKSQKRLPLLPAQRYFNFWTTMADSAAATDFVEALLRRVAELNQKVGFQTAERRRASRRSWTYGLQCQTIDGKKFSPGCPQVRRSFILPPPKVPSFELKVTARAALLNTVLLLGLYQDIDFSRESFRSVFSSVPADLQSASESWSHLVVHVLKLLSVSRTRCLTTMLGLFAAFMSSSMSACDSCMAASAWWYIWLREHVMNGRAKTMHKALHNVMELIANDKTIVITPAHELQAPAPEDSLQILQDVVHRLTFWSYPVGYYAAETLNCILLEYKSPGFAMRRRCEINDVRLASQVGRSRATSEARGRIQVLVNIQCPYSYTVKSLLDCKVLPLPPQQEARTLHLTKLLLVLHIFGTSGVPELVQEANSSHKSVVSRLPYGTLSSLYDMLLEIMEEASQMQEVENAQEHRRLKLINAWNEVVEASNSGDFEEADVGWTEPFEELTAARLIPLEFSTFFMEPSWTPCPSELESVPGTVKPQYTKSGAEEALLHSLEMSPFGRKGMSALSIRSSPEVVRVVVAGGNGTVHYVLLGYMNLVRSRVVAGGLQLAAAPQLVEFQFYVLPTGKRNSLATYIAQRDLWYDAMVHKPVMNRLPLIPHIGVEQGSSFSETIEQKPEPVLPSLMLTKQLENYIEEAHCTLEVCIFDCNGWFVDDRGNKKVCSIPFCVRAEIGFSVPDPRYDHHQLHHHCIPRRRSSSSKGVDEEDFSLKVKLVYRQLDWDDSEREERCEAARLGLLLVINVPSPSEKRLACNPSDDVLSICLVDSAVGGRRRVLAGEDALLQAATFKTRQLLVESKEQGQCFDIMLDGEVYGPFYKVRLGACRHPIDAASPVRFPVMTFWPTEIPRYG